MVSQFLTTDNATLKNSLLELFGWADEAYLVVAYATYSGFQIIQDEVVSFLKNGHKLRVLFDIEKYITDPMILEEFLTIAGDVECRVVFRSEVDEKNDFRTFHSKLYLFRTGDEVKAIVGSSNFTQSGINSNIESNLLVAGNATDDPINTILRFYETTWDAEYTIRLEENLDVLANYLELYKKHSRHNAGLNEELKNELKELNESIVIAQGSLQENLNTDSLYLLGLISGGGFVDEEGHISLRYEKGAYNKGTDQEGVINIQGISDVQLDQKKVLQRDVLGIVDRIGKMFKRFRTNDEIKHSQTSDYRYRIDINFDQDSQLKVIVHDFITQCAINRTKVVPSLPDEIASTTDSLFISFLRGYADIRSRISPTDRITNEGPLRVALSFSKGADSFAEEIKNQLQKRFQMRFINYFPGESRGRETMLRLDPVEVQKLPYRLYSINWKRLLLKDFAAYNTENYRERYLTDEDKGQINLLEE
ncbi:MAG: NgoFVII family restriction endonuclease [Candidatus Marinimicrobia bacterium]|nr:NgoFVII family restriction endonuclease [Candidatus Neomarinimicrobiota bacterium]